MIKDERLSTDVSRNQASPCEASSQKTIVWAPALGLCFLALLCLSVDMPIAGFVRAGRAPRFLHQALEQAEVFGHGVGVAYIILAAFVLDARRRNWTPTLLFGAYIAGLATDLLKLVVSRTRPRNLTSFDATVWETFGPLWHGQYRVGGDSHSFPSSHTATATGLAVVLGAMYPQARWLFYGFGALVGLQRIVSSSHFPSDVCAGAAVGWIIGQAALILRHWWRGAEPAIANGGL